MGLVMKKDDSEDNEYIDGIEVIGQGEGPKPEADGPFVELHNGPTAEDISGKTAAAEAERELEADPSCSMPPMRMRTLSSMRIPTASPRRMDLRAVRVSIISSISP